MAIQQTTIYCQTIDEFWNEVNKKSLKKFSQTFYPDKEMFEDYVSKTLLLDLKNLNVPFQFLYSLLLTKVTLKEYCIIVGKSYSSCIQNKSKYASLISIKTGKNNKYTLSKFESYHQLRTISTNFGEGIEYYVRNNDMLSEKLIDYCISNKKSIDEGIYSALKTFFKI